MLKKESKKKIQIKPKKDSKDKVIVKKTIKKVPKKQTHNKSKMFEIKLFSDLNTLKKLQIVVASIFLLSTLSIILAVVSDFFIAVVSLSSRNFFLPDVKPFMIHHRSFARP